MKRHPVKTEKFFFSSASYWCKPHKESFFCLKCWIKVVDTILQSAWRCLTAQETNLKNVNQFQNHKKVDILQ